MIIKVITGNFLMVAAAMLLLDFTKLLALYVLYVKCLEEMLDIYGGCRRIDERKNSLKTLVVICKSPALLLILEERRETHAN